MFSVKPGCSRGREQRGRHARDRGRRAAGRFRQIRCGCGFIARGETDEEVVTRIEGHISSDHPELAETLTRDEIVSWIEVVQ